MKRLILPLLALMLVLPLVFLITGRTVRAKKNYDFRPSEWFYTQRAYPFDSFSPEMYFKAIEHKAGMESFAAKSADGFWEPAGPSNIGGRITAIEVDPGNLNRIYAGAAAGGIFISDDGGDTYMPATDFFPSLSVGALRLDPNNSQIVYLGTGEANNSGDSYAGDGIYKSTDAGATWSNIGLELTEHIAEIKVHPMNSNLIYVAAAGALYAKNEHRGIYRSTDAGATWEKVFFVSDSTSAIDVEIDPTDPNRIYAAFYERMRSPTYRKSGGITSGVFMSTDGGTTWARLGGGLPAPDPVIGRISIAVAPSNPNYVYALYKTAGTANGTTNEFLAFYRSTNKGTTWTQMPDGSLPWEFSNFGWYFGLIEVDPTDHNKVYVGDVDIHYSTNGGQSWTNITNSYSGSFDMQHPDQHALWINPSDPTLLVNGNDGGMFVSVNRGSSWTKQYNLPISQFYATAVSNLDPNFLIGGTQDNGTMLTRDGGYDNWENVYGGDGFYCLVDYTDQDILYAEYQYGGIGKSTNGGIWFDYAGNGLDLARTNWSSPYAMDLLDHNTLYFGSYKLFKTTDGANNWTAISGDLTRGQNGRLGTITAIGHAPATIGNGRVFYVGSDDAKLSVSTDNGSTWIDRTGTLPRRYITDVVADPRAPNVAYVTLSGFTYGEKSAHVYRTSDYGVTWTNITGNLPDIPVNSLIIDTNEDAVLYVGCDVGVFITTDLGATWQNMSTGLPNVPISDLNFHASTHQLFAGTHGRSIFKFNTATALHGETPAFSKSFVLEDNYPNPFNPSTTISFTLSNTSKVKLSVYDIRGKLISELLNKEQPAGSYSVRFDASALATGVYFYTLQAEGRAETKKMVLIK